MSLHLSSVSLFNLSHQQIVLQRNQVPTHHHGKRNSIDGWTPDCRVNRSSSRKMVRSIHRRIMTAHYWTTTYYKKKNSQSQSVWFLSLELIFKLVIVYSVSMYHLSGSFTLRKYRYPVWEASLLKYVDHPISSVRGNRSTFSDFDQS